MSAMVRLDDVIPEIVEAMLPIGSPLGLYVRVRIEVMNQVDEDSFSERTYLHYLFARPTNYTKVWMAPGDYFLPEISKFRLRSDHDSCWRTDGVRDIYRVRREVEETVLNEAGGVRGHFSEHSRIDGIRRAELEWELDREKTLKTMKVLET